jgi:hypothetical protein
MSVYRAECDHHGLRRGDSGGTGGDSRRKYRFVSDRAQLDRLRMGGRPKGIGVFSQIAEWPMELAIVVDNDVTMSAREGTVFGSDSAGFSVRGFTQGNVVQDNRIRGRARAALAADVYRGEPRGTTRSFSTA